MELRVRARIRVRVRVSHLASRRECGSWGSRPREPSGTRGRYSLVRVRVRVGVGVSVGVRAQVRVRARV